MRDIDDVIISSSEYIMLKIIVNDIFDERLIIDKLRRQIYVVDELKINMLLKFDILSFEKIMINYHREVLILHYYRKMIVTMTVILIKQKVNRMMRVFIKIIVSIHFNIMIFVRLRNHDLSKERDYMFLFYQQFSNRFKIKENVFSHIIDVNMCAVQVNNIFETLIIINKNFRLNIVHDYEKKDCYTLTINYDYLIVDSIQSNARFNFD